MAKENVVPVVPIDVRSLIYEIRGQQVIFDRDLAMLYGVPTKVLNQSVKRNIERFPDMFMFQLSSDEVRDLRSQIATSSHNNGADSNLRSQFVTSSYGGDRYRPYAFTEQGVAMLSAGLIASLRKATISQKTYGMKSPACTTATTTKKGGAK